MSTTRARESKLREVLRRRAAHNGLELSGPAKTYSDYRAAVAGSAPAICYAYPMQGRLAEAERFRGEGSGYSGDGPLAAAIRHGQDSIHHPHHWNDRPK